MIAHIHPNRVCVYASPLLAEWLRRPLESIVGATIEQWLVPDWWPMVEPALERSLLGQPSSVLIRTQINAEGDAGNELLELQLRPETDRAGQVRGVFLLLDGGRGRQPELVGNEPFVGVLSQPTVVLFTLDAQGRIIRWQGTAPLEGASPLGQPLREVLSAGAAVDDLWQWVSSGAASAVSLQAQSEDQWLEVALSPQLGPGGQFTGAVGVLYDVTDRRRDELARRRLQESLQQKSEELESLLYAASHDLRSPLVNVLGFGQELGEISRQALEIISKYEGVGRASPGVASEDWQRVKQLLGDEVPEAVHFIQTSAAKMDQLLTGLLGISRLGRTTLDVQPLDMQQVVEQVCRSLDAQIKDSAAQIHFDGLPPCFGDPAQVRQILYHLIDNAVKYSRPAQAQQPPEVLVTGQQMHDRCVYCVSDAGPGVAPQQLPRVFQVFQRLEPQRCPGQGLGLPTVLAIVNRHGGRVWMESTPGRGSRVYFSLPTRSPQDDLALATVMQTSRPFA